MTHEENRIAYSLSPSKYLDNVFPERVFKDLYQYYDGTPESMIRVQGLLNDIIADNDMSVNKNKKFFYLRR